MALTRSFRETVSARAQRDAGYRRALLREALQQLVNGDVETGRGLIVGMTGASFAKLETWASYTGALSHDDTNDACGNIPSVFVSRTPSRSFRISKGPKSSFGSVNRVNRYSKVCPANRRPRSCTSAPGSGRVAGVAIVAVNSNDAELYPADGPAAMAEEKGFEPLEPLPVLRFSRPPPSTARPSLRR